MKVTTIEKESLGALGGPDEIIGAKIIHLNPGEEIKLTRNKERREYLAVIPLEGFGIIKFSDESSGDYMVAYYSSPRVQMNDPEEVTLCALQDKEGQITKPLRALVLHMRYIHY